MKTLLYFSLIIFSGAATTVLAQDSSAVNPYERDSIFGGNQIRKDSGKFSEPIQNFTPAKFPGGDKGWRNYLGAYLNTNVPVKRKAPSGSYTVVVRFVVGKDGMCKDIFPEKNPGYGMAEEVIRVVKNSPRWMPAIQNNKRVIYMQRQSITFQVE